MQTNKYTNIAFISYKREDERWAKWLQKKLEHYKLPIDIREQNPDLEFLKNPRHVFKDTTDLSGGVLEKAIKEGLSSSKYLIVICSPLAAKSPWVCKEVQEFIDSGREEYIIPFIIDGEPYSKDSSKECFPEALRSLAGERELLGININENGRDSAAVKVIARMFDLRFDTLWDRFKKEEKKRRIMILCIFIAAILFLLSVIAGGTIAYFEIQKERDRANNANKELHEANENIIKQKSALQKAYDNLAETKQSLVKSNADLTESNQRLIEEKDNVVRANKKMMVNQSKAVAEKVLQLCRAGDVNTAETLALTLLNDKDRPYVAELEAAYWKTQNFDDERYVPYSRLRGKNVISDGAVNEYQFSDLSYDVSDKHKEIVFALRGDVFIHNLITNEEEQLEGSFSGIHSLNYSKTGDSIIINGFDVITPSTCIFSRDTKKIISRITYNDIEQFETSKYVKYCSDYSSKHSALDGIYPKAYSLDSFFRTIVVEKEKNNSFRCNLFEKKDTCLKIMKSFAISGSDIELNPQKPEFLIHEKNCVSVIDAIDGHKIITIPIDGYAYNCSYVCNGEYLILERNIFKEGGKNELMPDSQCQIDSADLKLYEGDYDNASFGSIEKGRLRQCIYDVSNCGDSVYLNFERKGKYIFTSTTDNINLYVYVFDVDKKKCMIRHTIENNTNCCSLIDIKNNQVYFTVGQEIFRLSILDNQLTFLTSYGTVGGNSNSSPIGIYELTDNKFVVAVDQGYHFVADKSKHCIDYYMEPYAYIDRIEQSHADQLNSYCFIKGDKLCVISNGGVLRSFDILTGKSLYQYILHTNDINHWNRLLYAEAIDENVIAIWEEHDAIQKYIYTIPTIETRISQAKSVRELTESEKKQYYIE